MSRLWLKLALLPPELLKSHAQGYADLAAQELSHHMDLLKRRLWLSLLGLSSLLMGIGMGGVALLLWSALPQLDNSWSWVLLAVPLAFLTLGLALAWTARSLKMKPLFPQLKHQVQLDVLALQQVGKT